MYRRVALTATVACGALLFIGHLKRKFRRNACAAVRVFIHQLQKARHETLKAFLQPYAGVPDVVAKALRRERRRRNVNDLTPLVCCNSHHNAPMTAEETTLACGAASALVTLEPAARFVELLADCRLLVLCVPLSPETTGLVDAAALAALPSDAVVVNAARGPVVDEAALARFASGPSRTRPTSGTAPGDVGRRRGDGALEPGLRPRRAARRGDGALAAPRRRRRLPETERRRYAAVADAINAVAKSGDFARLATGPIGGLNIDAGY
ncbi:phosphoglycerate dehydrogenase [Aureococcus anophagefferens]|nr:phosphoglycerate dehydrogenase [Aureococcus anophagefferens]